MADFDSTFRYDSDFSKVTEDIKNLVREATNANSVFAQLNKTAASVKMEAARSFAAQAGFAGFKAQVVELTGATENFGQQLMKNKLTMKEYFSEAGKAYKKDSNAYKLAVREVRRANATVVNMGDVNGKRRGMLLTPDAIDLKNAKVRLQVAAKQYEIFNDLVNKGATSLVNWGKNTQWAGRQLTVGLTVPMGLFATKAIQAFSEVDKEITRFRKVYGSDLTGTVENATDKMLSTIQGMGAEFAKQYGIASKETIALAADLASAGFEGEKLANAVNQTTRMMVLGEVDRQQAMQATLSLQTAFNQSSKELAQSIDYLNAVENQTSASLLDLTEAIPKAGPVIQALGGDVKDLSILMTALREGGIASAEGANALKSGLASLVNPTAKASEMAKKFGIDLQAIVNRNKGELMPMLIDFQNQLQGMSSFSRTQLIENIFGKYQLSRITALFDNLNQRGSQTVAMVKLMGQSADELAKKSYSELQAQANSPSTKLVAMQQQLQEQLIKVGADLAQTLLPTLETGIGFLQKLIDGFNSIPGPIKSFAKIIGGAVAAAGPLLMLAGMMGNLVGNAIKFGMSIINFFKRLTGHPVQQLQILNDQELAAKLAAEQLTGAYIKQKTSVDMLNKSLALYVANLRAASSVAPPGAVNPGARPPRRFANGGVVYAKNGIDSYGQLNGYGGGDVIPAMLEPGEFVINKKSSKKFAPVLRQINNGSYGQFNGGTPDGVGNVFRSMDTGAGEGNSVNVYKYLSDKESKASATSIIKELRMLPKTPAVADLLRALDISDTKAQSMGRQWGLAASHLTESGFAVNVGDKKAIKKNYIGTSALESYGYNSLIENIASGDTAMSKTRTLQTKIPSDYPNRSQLLRILSSTSAPIEPNDIKILNSFFKDIKTNPALSTAFLTRSGSVTKSNPFGKESNDKIGKLNESLKYLDELEKVILSDEAKIAAGKQTGYTEYANLRKNQIIGATIVTLPNNVRNELVKKYGYDGLIKMVGQDVNRVIGPLASGELKGAQLRSWIRTSMLDLSQKITGREVLGSREMAALESTSAYGKRKSFEGLKLPASKLGTLSGESKVISYLARRFGKGFSAGGPVGAIFEKMVQGVRAANLKKEELALVSAQMKRMEGSKTLFSGGIADTKWLNSLKPGDRVKFPGATSTTDDMAVARDFAAKHELGGTYNNIQRQYTKDELRAMGLDDRLIGWKQATSQEEAMQMIREIRIQELLKLRDARDKMKALRDKKLSIESSPYPSQLGQMFPAAPLPHEVMARNKELTQIDREIMNAQSSDWAAKQQLDRYRKHVKVYGRSTPVTAAFVTREGTPYLPVNGNVTPGSLQAGVAKGERESILSDIEARFIGKQLHNGVEVPTFEVTSAGGSLSSAARKPWGLQAGGMVPVQKFAFGGRVGRWMRPPSPGEVGYEESVAWGSDKMSEFRKLKVKDVITDPVPGRPRRIKYSKLAENPAFNKDRLFRLLKTLDIVPAEIPLMRATTLNPGVSTEFSREQQLKLMNAIRAGKFDELFGMELNQKGLASFTSVDPRTGANGAHGIGIFHIRGNPVVYGDNRRTGRSKYEEVRTGTGRIEKYHSGYAVNDGRIYVGPNGMEQIYISHRTSGAERGRVISPETSRLDELLTYKLNSIIEAVSTTWAPGARAGTTIIHTRGVNPIQGRKSGGVIFGHGMSSGGRLNGYGGGDKVPAMLEPGEFIINKEASAANFGLLQQINGGMVQAKRSGGLIQGFRAGGLAGQGGAMAVAGGMAMNLMFLPMMLEQAKSTEGIMQKLLYAVLAIQGTVAAMQAFQLMGAGLRGLGNVAARGQGLAARGADLARTGGLQRASAFSGPLSKASGILKQGAGKAMTMAGAGIARMAPLLFNPITAALAVASVAIVGGILLWRRHVDDLAKDARSMYTQATEMAKVYNIEINTTARALEKNANYLRAFGLEQQKAARGQVDKDYAKAVTKDFGNLINVIKATGNEQQKTNMLSSQYASLIAQGFGPERAKEITAEIARQAGATAQFSSILPTLQQNILNAADAMDVITVSVSNQISVLGTGEERLSAFHAAWTQLVNASTQDTPQFLKSINSITEALQKANPDDLKQGVADQLNTAGIDSANQDAILNNLFGGDPVDWSSKKGLEVAQTLSQAIGLNIDVAKYANKGMSLGELKITVAADAAAIKAKEDLNKVLDAEIKKIEGTITATEKYYDTAIKGVQDEMDAIQKAHEKKQKALEDEADRLNDRKDLIQKNTDFYIKQLEKEYQAEQYYQKQRETAVGALQSLSQGDIFGYLKAQQQAASDASQYGREQAMAQIQDTSDAAQGALDNMLKKNGDAQKSLQDSTDKQLQQKQDEMDALQTERSNVLKDLRERLNEAKDLLESPKVATTAIEKFQGKMKKTIDGLPSKMQKPFDSIGDNLLTELNTAANNATAEVVKTTGVSAKLAAQKVEEAFGEVANAGVTKYLLQAKGFSVDASSGKVTFSTAGGAVNGEKKMYRNSDLTKRMMSNGIYNIYDSQGKLIGSYNAFTGFASTDTSAYGVDMFDITQIKEQKRARGGKVMGIYSGGSVVIPGFGNSDKVPVLATPGEMVVNKSATKLNAKSLALMNAGVSFDKIKENSYGRMSEKEVNNSYVEMPVNITINGYNGNADELARKTVDILMTAQKKLQINPRGN